VKESVFPFLLGLLLPNHAGSPLLARNSAALTFTLDGAFLIKRSQPYEGNGRGVSTGQSHGTAADFSGTMRPSNNWRVGMKERCQPSLQ
jgi:hypothetical protein